MQTFLVQAIGFLGVACFILSFQIRSNKALFILQMAGSGMFCIQYLFLGAFTGCLNLFVAIIRNLLLCRINKWKWVQWKGWIVVFSLAGVVILFFTWTGPLSLLPAIALIAGNIGNWSNNAQTIRLCNMTAISPAWLIYGFVNGSIGAVLNEIIVLVSIFVSIYRYGWKNMGESSFGKDQ